MKNKTIIAIISVGVLVLILGFMWFRDNYMIIKRPEQTLPAQMAQPSSPGSFVPTPPPGLDPVKESKGPTYPPPSRSFE